jgi:hypothetical protein
MRDYLTGHNHFYSTPFALLIGFNKFCDYNTIDAVLDIPALPENKLYILEWKDPKSPLFETPEGLIQKAGTFA